MKSLRVIDHGNSNTNKNTTQNEVLLKDKNFSKHIFELGKNNKVFTLYKSNDIMWQHNVLFLTLTYLSTRRDNHFITDSYMPMG